MEGREEKKSKLQVLVSTMNQTDKSLIKRMNLRVIFQEKSGLKMETKSNGTILQNVEQDGAGMRRG